ncbi:hypothetical protein ACFL0M_06855 [Thermodesulfobacteriota bacterium]
MCQKNEPKAFSERAVFAAIVLKMGTLFATGRNCASRHGKVCFSGSADEDPKLKTV